MAFQSLFHNLDDPVNLCNPKRTNLTKLRYILIPLRNASSNNNRLLDLLRLTDHTQESILRRILNSTAVNEDQIGLVRAIHNVVAVIGKLTDHELAIWDVMGAAECLHVDVVGPWDFLFCLDEEVDLGVVDLLLFLLLVF